MVTDRNSNGNALQPAVPPSVMQWIVQQHENGKDRSQIVDTLVENDLPWAQASQLVSEVLAAEELGQLARTTPASRLQQSTRALLETLLATLAAFALALTLSWLGSFLPTVFDWIALRPLGSMLASMIGTLTPVIIGFVGTVIGLERGRIGLVAGVWFGALLYYGAVTRLFG